MNELVSCTPSSGGSNIGLKLWKERTAMDAPTSPQNNSATTPETKDADPPVRKIIVEGPPCSGKTAYANNFIGWPIWNYQKIIPVEDWVKKIVSFREYLEIPGPLVLDQSPISESVCGKYLGRREWFFSSDINSLLRGKYGDVEVHFLMPDLKVLNQLVKISEVEPRIVDCLEDIYYDYDMICNYAERLSKHTKVIDTTEKLEKVLETRRDSNPGLRDTAYNAASGVSPSASGAGGQRE